MSDFTKSEPAPRGKLPVDSVRRLLFRILLVLSLAGLASEIGKEASGGIRPFWSQMMSLSYEQNVPTWYSAGQIFVCAAVMAWIALVERGRGARYVGHWWGMSAVFGYISLDETVSIHENAGNLVSMGGGLLYFDWIIPAAIVVACLGLIYLKFLWYLPARTRIQFIVAGSVFVGGAMGVEMFLGYWTDHFGNDTLGYGLIDLIEETMEILGMSLFLCALLEYFGERFGGIAESGGASDPRSVPETVNS